MKKELVYNHDRAINAESPMQIMRDAYDAGKRFLRVGSWVYFTPDGVKFFGTPIHVDDLID